MRDRSHEVTRLEGFSDAVFGFALTLLVVSLETPQNDADLRALVRGLFPFALTFAMVCWIWFQHNVFFRRYGLQDAWTVFLNCCLLFVVLFYVYPLKYLTSHLFGALAGDSAVNMQQVNGQFVMLVYSSGVVVIFTAFLMLHWHAWRKRQALALDARGLLQLRYSTRAHAITMMLGAISVALALIFPRQSAYAGLLYTLMGPLHGWNGFQGAKALSAAAAHPVLPPEA